MSGTTASFDTVLLDNLGQSILDETGASVLIETGAALSFASRLRAVLPARWFPDRANSPVLEALLEALGANWSDVYDQVQFAALQTRIASATGAFLDMAALDYLDGSLIRRPGQPDAAFAARVQSEVIRPRVTRASVTRVLEDLTGRTPAVFEPARPTDTGGIGFLGMTAGSGLSIGSSVANAGTTVPFYAPILDETGQPILDESGAQILDEVAGRRLVSGGGIGSLALRGQAFVTAYRPASGGIPNVGGIYSLASGGRAEGGIGSLANPSAAGAMEIGSFSQSSQVTDAEIYAAVASVMPAGGIAWVSIGS